VWYDARAVRRNPYGSGPVSFSFGPGPITPAVKALIIANIGVFLLVFVVPVLTLYLGLIPAAVVTNFAIWQPVTYMFVHGDMWHILFNMLVVWMFGVQLERLWGTAFFTRYYFVTGVGAALTTMLVGLLPFGFADGVWTAVTIGASGAVYGLLLAFALYYPDRPIFFMMLFPVPAKYFVMIIGAIALLSSLGAGSSRVAHAAHLGGLVVGYVYLTMGRGGPMAELKYRWLKWRMGRMRRRFEVHSGGRGQGGPWSGRIH
jgi:membrane associated rhomboid family serine protease